MRSLVAECFIARLDLDEENAAFVARLQEIGARSVKRAALTRLVRCARVLGVIESTSV